MERLTLVITGDTRSAVEDALEHIAMTEGVSVRDHREDEADDGTHFSYQWDAAALDYTDLDRICGALRERGGEANMALLNRLRQLREGAAVCITNEESS